VGAGDAFTSGLLAWLNDQGKASAQALKRLTGAEIGSLLRFAAAVAGLTCSRPGADPPRRAEVERALAGPA
jgi:fructokinase